MNAHTSIPEIKKLIDKFYESFMIQNNIGSIHNSESIFSATRGPLYNYRAIIDQALANEEKYKNSHYVFYHTQNYKLKVVQDLMQALCTLNNTCSQAPDFIYLRNFTKDFFNINNLNQWLDKKIAEHATNRVANPNLQFKNDPSTEPYALFTNLALFGNIGCSDSNSFKEFIRDPNIQRLQIGKLLNRILTPYTKNVPHKAHLISVLNLLAEDTITDALIPNSDEATALKYTIYTQENQLLQIFIPRNLIDLTAFLTKENEAYWPIKIEDISGWDKILERYSNISPVLDIYRNNPQKFNIKFDDPSNTDGPGPNIILDRLAASVILKGELFSDPKSGLKIFRYSTIDPQRETEYQKRLNIIANHIHNLLTMGT